MKITFSIVRLVLGMALAFSFSANAQEQDVKIPISVLPPVADLDSVAHLKLMVTRLQQAVSRTGVSEYASYNFVLYPKINVVGLELTSGAPTLTVVNLEVTLNIANGYQRQGSKNIIFGSETFSLKGVGKSEDRAMLEAVRSLRADDPRLQQFIQTSRQVIVRYFAANCESIIDEAQTLTRAASLAVADVSRPINSKSNAAENQFSHAINLLYNIRSANYSCYKASLSKINQIFDAYDDFSCRLYLARAKNHWAARDINETICYLNKIPPSDKCRTEVDALLRQMDSYQETSSETALKQEIRLLREREAASKDMLETIMAGQKRETASMRDTRKQETIINVLGPPAPAK